MLWKETVAAKKADLPALGNEQNHYKKVINHL